jgi:MATE family multidrug resistance protein
MVGRLGAAALGGVGIGNGLYFAITVVGMGSVLGMDPLVAQALGAGEHARGRQILRDGLRVAWLLGAALTAVVALSPLLLGVAGVDAATAAACRAYLFGRLPNVVPFLIFTALRSWLQAYQHTRAIVWAMVLSNVANFFFDALLIYGDGALRFAGLPGVGLPALGVIGAGIATSLSSVLSAVVLALAVHDVRPAQDAEARAEGPPEPAPRPLVRDILRLGTPLAGQYLAEVGVFALVGVLAGRLGAVPSAGHQVAIQLASFTFTVTLGIAAATSTQVGRAVGRADTPGARRAGLLGLASSVAFMAFSATAFLAAPRGLAWLLTNDATVIAATVPLVRIAAFFQLSDGLQVTGAGALRGAGDTRAAFWANLAGHYGVGLPVALLLGFGLRWGAVGLWWGLSAGLTATAVALVARFLVLSRKPIARV